ncbi:aminotransferase class I/II-fold pyridoxal phosphate-dependent enzyme [Emcibacteraceae bacterium]|nr:aminotransferase class I/II-fold pyridoxal phosphate-dependent enzyme [Emcibacteraceae bacterium]
MKVEIHKLFEVLLKAQKANPETSVVHSLAKPPVLGDFLGDLDPNLVLDWSDQSFHGLPSLRQKVVERFDYSPICTSDKVLITAGTAEANFLAISNIVGPGDEMIVDVPGWPQPLVLGKAIGATVKKLERQEDNGWMFYFGQLEELITEKTKLIFLCNPNNPTGHVLNEADLLHIVNLADKVGAYVLTDEVYRNMEWNCPLTPRMATLYDRGISTGSVSKVLGLQGLRTGWMVTRDKNLLFDSIVLREDTSEIMNIMGEAIADIALREDRFKAAVRKARKSAKENLDLLDDFVKTHDELSWVRPVAGLIGLCKLNIDLGSTEVAETLLKKPYSLMVMPGSAYGYPNHIRVGAGGGSKNDIEKGLDRLDQYFKCRA